MSRKDYELIADAIRAAQPDNSGSVPATSWHLWDKVVREMAVALRATNPRFDSAKFIRACEKAN